MAHQWLTKLTRARPASGRVGVFATPAGVAVAHVATAASGKPRLTRCVYEREGGRDVLARAAARLPNRRAPAVGVLDQAAYRLLLVEAPDVPTDELRAAVRWRIKDLVDFHVDDAVIDVFEMPRHARGGPQRPMYAVAAKADVVKHEIDRIEAAGLRLDVVDIPELCLRNVAKLLDAGRGTALLHLSERRGTLLLVRQGVLYLARHIETGVATLEEAGELRSELVSSLALEVRRSLDYLESHYEQTSIRQLFVVGLEAADRDTIARDLGVSVADVDLASLFVIDEAPSPELARLCMPAIGAALREDAIAL